MSVTPDGVLLAQNPGVRSSRWYILNTLPNNKLGRNGDFCYVRGEGTVYRKCYDAYKLVGNLPIQAIDISPLLLELGITNEDGTISMKALPKDLTDALAQLIKAQAETNELLFLILNQIESSKEDK